MRIAHFVKGRCNPDSANGVDKTAFNLSRTQASVGHPVAVFSLTAKKPITIEGVEVRHFRPRGSTLGLPHELVEEIVAWRPDVVHLHSAYVPENIWLASALRRRRVPYAVTPNGLLSPRLLRRRWYLKVPFRYFIERSYLNRAIFLHAVSPNEVNEFRRYKINVPVVEAPNGIELSDVPANLREGVLRERFPMIGERRVALFLGRLDIMQKGLDLLLQAVSSARADLSDLVVLLAGPDWSDSRRKLRRMIDRERLEDRVLIVDPVFGKRKFEFLSDAEVFVHVSRWEGLPFSVLEALACGTPCLLTEPTNLAGVVARYGAGRIVDLDRAAIIAGLRYFTTAADAEIQLLGSRSRELVAREFNWTRIAGTIVAAYDRAVANGRLGRRDSPRP